MHLFPDPWQTGTRPTASYWGGMGEQIDTHPGNLNYDFSSLGEFEKTNPIGSSFGKNAIAHQNE
ncbi:MAG: hypothetical protein ACR2JB_21315 [Bryobacteraceae bacterium]